MSNTELNKEILDILDNVIYWETCQKDYKVRIKAIKEQLTLTDVGSSLPDLAESNQASLDYATKKDNPDFFLIKQTFKEGINWALNYMTKNK